MIWAWSCRHMEAWMLCVCEYVCWGKGKGGRGGGCACASVRMFAFASWKACVCTSLVFESTDVNIPREGVKGGEGGGGTP